MANNNDTVDSVLGQEFLTWLWFKTEVAPASFTDSEGKSFSVEVMQRVTVQGGEGEFKEIASVSGGVGDGEHLPLREARLGLQTGKKVTRAVLLFEQDSMQWQMTAKSDDFAFASLKTPKPASKNEEDDPDAIFYEKMYLVERAVEFFDILYKKFLDVRLNVKTWEQEVKSISDWMLHQE